MTRGQITVILNDETIWTSTEFNGDMYYKDGHGKEIMETFPKVTTLEEYKEYVKWFNETHYNYNEEELTYELTDMSGIEDENYIFTYEEFLDMRTDYFKKWFEDYLYIKNLSDETVQFIDAKGNVYNLEPMEIAVLNFGEYTDEVPNNGLKLDEELTDELLEDLLESKFSDLDWNFSINHYGNGSQIYISKYSPAGEDFGFEVEGSTVEEIVKEIVKYANDFDAEEHVLLWVEGCGRNGVPGLRALLEDADEIQEMLDKLAEEVSKITK